MAAEVVATVDATTSTSTWGNKCPLYFFPSFNPLIMSSVSTSTGQTASSHILWCCGTPSRSRSSVALDGIMGWRSMPASRRE